MIYEIINMSDVYTMEINNLEHAAIAILLLGDGWYGAKPADNNGAEEIPIMALGGGHDWFQSHFNRSMEDSLKSVCNDEKMRLELSEVFDSIIIGSPSDRYLYLKAIEKMTDTEKEKFQAEWHDKKRSSMNDIGARAKKYAEMFRKPLLGVPR